MRAHPKHATTLVTALAATFALGLLTQSAAAVPGCPGDINGDGNVDQIDLGILLAEFGSKGSTPADINGDGVVGQVDLGILLAKFNAGCP